MGASLDDFSVIQDEDQIRSLNRGEAVCDYEDRSGRQNVIDGHLYETFCRGVDAGCGFIEDDERGISAHRASE